MLRWDGIWPAPIPSETPLPTATGTPAPTSPPTLTATPLCEPIGVTLAMPATFFRPGQPCGLTADICLRTEQAAPVPLYVLLDVGGTQFGTIGWWEFGFGE